MGGMVKPAPNNFNMPKIQSSRWSILYEKCNKCGSHNKPHEAKGYCVNCYSSIKMKEYRKIRPQKNYRKETRTGFKYSDAPRPRANECEICQRQGRTVLDHSHATGRFRGWLCNQCNTSLGMIKDRIEILHKMIEYLIKNP